MYTPAVHRSVYQFDSLHRGSTDKLLQRLRDNQAGVEGKRFDHKQALQVFTDPKVLLLAIMIFCASTPNGQPLVFFSLRQLTFSRYSGAASSFTTLVIRDVCAPFLSLSCFPQVLIHRPQTASTLAALCSSPFLPVSSVSSALSEAGSSR